MRLISVHIKLTGKKITSPKPFFLSNCLLISISNPNQKLKKYIKK